MVSALISKLIMLVFGTLFPAYRSYKAIKNKNVREYVKWMMYWIIFALFITSETFADMFLSWLPLYYEIKVIFIIWLLSPATKGSSILYRKFVHPRLVKHERAIDKYIAEAQKNGYAALMHVGRRGLTAASETIVRTAATGQTHLINTLRRCNSMQDLFLSDTESRPRQQSWHVGMAAPNPNFDPDADADVLQKQYKSYRQRDFIAEDSQAESVFEEETDGGCVETFTQNYDVMSSKGTVEADEMPLTSQTLPRMRKSKERKPIAGVFPESRSSSRTVRVSSSVTREKAKMNIVSS